MYIVHSGKESRELGLGRREGKESSCRGTAGGVGDVRDGVQGPRGREKGWGTSGKESWDQGARRRGGGRRGRSPGTRGPGGRVGEVRESVQGAGGW